MAEILLPLGTQSETGLYAKALSISTNVLSAAIALSEVPNSGGLYTNSGAISGLTVGQEYLLLAYKADGSLIAKGGPAVWTGVDFLERSELATTNDLPESLEALKELIAATRYVYASPPSAQPPTVVAETRVVNRQVLRYTGGVGS